jgi:hypothetical protein
MRRTTTQAAWFSAVLASASAAWATHPDHEGERGVEAHFTLGYGSFTAASDRVFLTPADASVATYDAFTGGVDMRLGAGYRMLPYLSAGIITGVQFLGAEGQYSPLESRFGARDSFISYNVGAYARLYLGSLLNGARTNPRVFFHGAGDRRRFDPFVSLGVDFVRGIQRSRSYTEPQNLTSWNTSYIGIPVVVGVEYRVIPRFAVGLNLGVTTLVAGVTTKLTQSREVRPGLDEITRTSTDYTPASDINFNLWLGLSARYTLTF